MLSKEKEFRSGLLGKMLGHSLSPQIHALLGNPDYTLFEKKEDEIEAFLSGDFDGINVTIPYKKAVMPYLTHIDAEAESIGSVNTVIRKNGALCGYNTDIYGFEKTLERANIAFEGKKILVLGSGGAAQTVLYAAKKHNGAAYVVSRSGELNYGNCLSLHPDAQIIVNTTPVGMYPNNGVSPFSIEGFGSLEAVVDLIYNPQRTALLLEAERRGIKTASCLDMLFYQALRACEIFFDKSYDKKEAERLYRTFAADMRNIVLIGMPGSGKSTVGKLIAKKLGRQFIDTDGLIEQKYGISCAEIINNYGEAEFRTRETEAVKAAGALTNAVIATGGGAPTVNANTDPIKQNSRIYYLDRAVSALATEGRPLSAGDLNALLKKRLPSYLALADGMIKVTDPENTAAAIIKEHYDENTCY